MPVTIDEVESQTATNTTSAQDAELVRKIADRVYAMLKEELRVERERLRLIQKQGPIVSGGREHGW
jgi:hypothetical protein